MSERDEPATAETPCAEPPDSPARAPDPPDVYDLLLAPAGQLDADPLAWAPGVGAARGDGGEAGRPDGGRAVWRGRCSARGRGESGTTIGGGPASTAALGTAWTDGQSHRPSTFWAAVR